MLELELEDWVDERWILSRLVSGQHCYTYLLQRRGRARSEFVRAKKWQAHPAVPCGALFEPKWFAQMRKSEQTGTPTVLSRSLILPRCRARSRRSILCRWGAGKAPILMEEIESTVGALHSPDISYSTLYTLPSLKIAHRRP